METISCKFCLESGKSYFKISTRCNFPSNINSFQQQKASSWLGHGTEHQKIHNITIALSNNHKKARILSLSPGLADAAATTADTISKPVDVSVLIQTSAVLLFMYLLANFVVPQIIIGRFNAEEENERQQAEEERR